MRICALSLVLFFLLSDVACSSEAALERLVQETLASPRVPKKGAVRFQALCHSARVYGFQKGFQWKYAAFMRAVRQREDMFEALFDFRRLLIGNRMLPPIVRWAGPSARLVDETEIRVSRESYQIVAPARMVLRAPTFREYFQCDTSVLPIEKALLPESAEERGEWKKALAYGWREGVAHAQSVFDASIHRLASDYRGMLRFLILEKEGRVTAPVLQRGALSERVDETKRTLEPEVFQITAPARFTQGGDHK
ncbi:MAG: type IV secretory system conjugative DNA transfer family protein [Desulfovibrionaceae bacterium]|nr:type IV secretory system conjugative DNA transfer family protein [Desulfovibrionaceae bacterium]